ncbi:MAG: phenylalanine--tRNA ligase subunit beta [Chloroflexota bacterium]
MRVPLSWLREYVDVDLTPEQLADRLTVLGMEVQGIERIGDDWQNVVVGELLEVAKHPNSNRLSLTRVNVGDGVERSIVCGATNIAVGQRVPVSLPGAVLPGDRRIEVTRIAGVESQGMLCSGAELALTMDSDGILILPETTPIGVALTDLLGDVVLDVDVKPNRGDALSIVGLAREVAAATGATLRWPEIVVEETGDATADHLRVTVEDPRCSVFVGRYLDGVKVGPSPIDVQRRLMSAGVRPISNVVDASNYVMLELGKPIHTFDASAIHEGHIVVRAGRSGERMETLDHIARDVDPDVLLIADPAGPLAIAGVMGGATSEVGDGTTTVVVESAIFDPVSIRRTAFRYALRSEASLRFEKGQEHRLARLGADRTAQLILRWAGGRAARGVVDTNPEPVRAATVAFRPARVNRLLGTALSGDEQRELLRRVEVETVAPAADQHVTVIAGSLDVPVAPGEEAWVAVVPGHRRDLAIEADIAEEIARVQGYDALAGRLPETRSPGYRPDPWRIPDQVRALLTGRGLAEVVTHGLVGPDDHARLGLAADDPATIRATNPVTMDHSELRRDLLPSLVRVLADNERQRRDDVAIFELGSRHTRIAGAPVQEARLGILLAGTASPVTWHGPARAAELADLTGLVAWLADRLGSARVHLEPADARPGVDHPYRTAMAVAITADGSRMELGRVGELHPGFLAAYDIRAEHVVIADLSLDALERLVPDRLRVGSPPRLPSVERDIAWVTDAGRAAGDVVSVIRAAAGPLLRDVLVFDRYQGAPLAPDEVSLAFRLRFEPADGPVDDVTLDSLMVGVSVALRDHLGGRLRD